ncbi:MAG: carbohydrate-binding domain-containing protein [Paludibacteraceae bacterium]|nr:carbohydrate-binding domain-containing protein [Paludibacteraceae bacterium]
MKRILILIFTIFVGLLLWAQKSIIFHIGNIGKDSIKISDIDTVRFNNGKISVEGKETRTYNISDVDSATFDLGARDTVFITYQNNSVTIDNPYGEEAIETYTNDAHATLISHVGKKGVVYYLSGSSSEGVFELTPDKGYTLVFDNLSLSGDQAPIVLNKGLDDESYAANIHLIGKSNLSDGNGNNLKSTIYTKSKLKISQDSLSNEGELTIQGKKQHAINSSKRIEIYSGTVSIDQAEGDGINADGLEMYGGKLSIKNTKSDGVDCSELIYMEDGEISLSLSSDDSKGLKCDSVVEIKGGTLNANITGNGSKAIRGKQKTTVSGGLLQISLEGKEPFIGTDNDYGYNTGISCDGDVEITGNGTILINGNGIAAKGINTDANVIFNGGETIIDLTGKYYNETANKDTVSCAGVKCDGKFTMNDGKVDIHIGSDATLCKGINADGDIEITNGSLIINVEGGYYITGQTQSGGGGGMWSMGGGAKTKYSYATSKIIKAGRNFTMTGGLAKLNATLGKGIICDGDIIIGKENGANEDLTLVINAGSEKNETHTHDGGSIEGVRTKAHGSPKGMKADGNVTINSGCIDIYAYDTGILAEQNVTINGGNIEVDAPYDQGVFGRKELNILGGYVRVPSSYEAFSGANITLDGDCQTYVVASDDAWNATDGNESSSNVHIYLKGGIHYAQAEGDGLDSNGEMIISGGITVVAQRHSLNSPLDAEGITHKGGFVLAVGGNGMFNESIPVASEGHIYNSSFTLKAGQYIVVANNSGSVLAALKMPLDPYNANNGNGAVCTYNANIKNYNFYIGNNFNGELNYFDGTFGFYEPEQNFNLNQLQRLDVKTETGNGSAFNGGGWNGGGWNGGGWNGGW